MLLFCELCIDNKDLPVLFAFESGFELIISILDSEGWTDGGIIVLDCLRLATLILDDNTNTQSFQNTFDTDIVHGGVDGGGNSEVRYSNSGCVDNNNPKPVFDINQSR